MLSSRIPVESVTCPVALAACSDQIALHISESVGVMAYAGESGDVTGTHQPLQQPGLLAEVRRRLRLKLHRLRTEQADEVGGGQRQAPPA